VRRAATEQNWYLLTLAIALALGGIALLYSASQTATGTDAAYWQFQLIWLFVALVVYAVIGVVPMRWIEKITRPAYALSLVVLVAVLAFPAISGARSWIRFGALGFQPSEFAKIATILVVAQWAARLKTPPHGLAALVVPAFLVGIPAALTLLQPDLGTAIVYVLLLAALCFWAGSPPVVVFLLLSPLVSVLLTFSLSLWSLYARARGWFLLRPPVPRGSTSGPRICSHGDRRPPLWNQLTDTRRTASSSCSRRAIRAARVWNDPVEGRDRIRGWFGKGFLEALRNDSPLPERHTDFIFSVLGEELGFLGVLVAFALLGMLLLEGVRIADRNPDPYASTVAFGLVALIDHLAINTAMTGMLPITDCRFRSCRRAGRSSWCASPRWRCAHLDRAHAGQTLSRRPYQALQEIRGIVDAV
jgi:rod shape determining protein RodA